MSQPPARSILALVCLIAMSLGLGSGPARVSAGGLPTLANPILFVTHVPTPFDIVTTVTTFNNHTGDVHAAGRGGDLWLRLTDGTLKNITQLAGYGTAGLQGANSIAVRDPYISWDGTRALFSMVIGAPTQPTATPPDYFWQMYELTNLGQIIQNPNTIPTIVKVANQPQNYNNITPVYGTNGRIIFTSDRPRNGQAYLYPLLDEYNMRPTVSGLWSLDSASGDLFLMDHSPSGDLSPSIDSYGRVVFVRWDHLERDQQSDVDALGALQNPPKACTFCTFNYSDETAAATKLATNLEAFPEPRPQRTDLLAGTNLSGHHMNEFLPWQIDEDGTNPETINHVGRHELLAHMPPVFNNDPNIKGLNGAPLGDFNQSRIGKFLQLKEDAKNPGTFYGTDVLELTHGSGQIIKLIGGQPGNDADHMGITYITHRDTLSTTLPLINHSDGHYRDPLPMSDGTLIASYTTKKTFEAPIPNQPTQASTFDFRLYDLGPDASNPGYFAHNQLLTGSMQTKTLSYYDKTTLISRSNIQLWELQPVEVRARSIPATLQAAVLAAPEQDAFTQAGVTPAQLQTFLSQHNLSLIVSRNVTSRDHSDVEQPLRLQIGTNGAITAPGSGTLYHINHLQLFQADQLRGMNGSGALLNPPGRRVLAQPLHDPAVLPYNPPNAGGPTGSVALGADGSMAAFVPARRAITWQLTDNVGTPVVRERIWVTTQPGEIRVCASCHGVNQTNQAGLATPQNTPQALIQLLQYWKQQNASAPTLLSLSQTSTSAGSASFTLSVTGTNFANNAQIQWNGVALTTTFISSTQLSAAVPSAQVANVGSIIVTALNPGTGLATGGLTFTITGVAATSHYVYLPSIRH